MTRRRLTLSMKVEILFAQARCPLCGEALGSPRNVDYDHAIALTNGGQDHPTNMRAVHRDCHKQKTFGKGGAKRISKRGSDISEPLRIERISEKHREFVRTVLKPGARKKRKAAGPKRKWASRPFRSKKP